MITIRMPQSIYVARGRIQDGTFEGRWHFSFDEYRDADHVHFGVLRVFNDDTLSPGAVWPLHPHREVEVVTYCAEGEFRHADERGAGGVLKKGWVQHTTVGRGMWHSEINNRKDRPMRFLQMWFMPAQSGLEPSVEQKPVTKAQRTNRFLLLVAPEGGDALAIRSNARVLSSFLEKGRKLAYSLGRGRGGYLYVLDGGPVEVQGHTLPAVGAAMLRREEELRVGASDSAELLLVDVALDAP